MVPIDQGAQLVTKRRTPTSEERDIIWRAHNKKCAFTGEPISYAELHIDHVIPLDGGDEIIAELLKKNLIPLDFNLNGTENLIPTSSSRNRQKGETPFNESSTIYYLDIARRKKKAIDDAINASRSNASIWANLLKTQADMAAQGYEPEEYFSILRSKDHGEAALRFPLEVSGEAIRVANSAVAEGLMDKPFSLGGGQFHSVTGEHDDREKAVFGTPREFLRAQADGYYPITSFDMNMWGAAERVTSTLQALRSSKFAPHSAIRFPRVTLANFDRWSSTWITGYQYPDIEVDVADLTSKHPTIADLLEAGIATKDEIEEGDDWIASFHWDHGFSVKMYELMRADLDEDDQEEVLISRIGWAKGGTLRMPQINMAKPDGTGLIFPYDYKGPELR